MPHKKPNGLGAPESFRSGFVALLGEPKGSVPDVGCHEQGNWPINPKPQVATSQGVAFLAAQECENTFLARGDRGEFSRRFQLAKTLADLSQNGRGVGEVDGFDGTRTRRKRNGG